MGVSVEELARGVARAVSRLLREALERGSDVEGAVRRLAEAPDSGATVGEVLGSCIDLVAEELRPVCGALEAPGTCAEAAVLTLMYASLEPAMRQMVSAAAAGVDEEGLEELLDSLKPRGSLVEELRRALGSGLPRGARVAALLLFARNVMVAQIAERRSVTPADLHAIHVVLARGAARSVGETVVDRVAGRFVLGSFAGFLRDWHGGGEVMHT